MDEALTCSPEGEGRRVRVGQGRGLEVVVYTYADDVVGA